MISFKYLVTSALPYVNYKLHIGHLIGCLLPGDIYSRFLKLRGEDCVYVGGADAYGTPTLVAAEKEGISPEELSNKYYEEQKKVVEGFNLAFDIYSKTNSPEHTKLVQDLYHKLKQNNFIYRKKIKQLYCEKCARSLPDRYVEGICPFCGKEGARGDQCDECGKLLEPMQLKEPYCVVCKTKPVLKESEHIFFELSKLGEKLQKWIEENKGIFPNAKRFSLNWIKGGLEDRCISRDIKWGIPIPDAPGKVFYVWFDAPIGYITFLKQIGKENWWHDKNTKLVHFLGKDNIAFHTIFFPGMLIAIGDFVLADSVASYEFLNWAGSKLSKSKGNMITLDEALELYDSDYWRYVLTSIQPEARDSDFTWELFEEIVNNDLNDAVGNFIHRTLTFTKKFYDGKIPKPDKFNEKDKEVLKSIEDTYEKVTELLSKIKLKEALNKTVNLARIGNQYLSEEEPWKNEKRKNNVIYICLNISHSLSILLEPFIPNSANKIKKYLGKPEKQIWSNAKELLEPEKKISDFEPLFKKVDVSAEVKT